jgi:hypothetical protein
LYCDKDSDWNKVGVAVWCGLAYRIAEAKMAKKKQLGKYPDASSSSTGNVLRGRYQKEQTL